MSATGDLRRYGDPDAPGLEDAELPERWTRFNPEDGEARGAEAYIHANGHQVLICEAAPEGEDGFSVLAYPEQGMADLCGFVRPLRSPEAPENADLPRADTLEEARAFAAGYMAAVNAYEPKEAPA